MEVYSFDIGGHSIKHAHVRVDGGRASITARLPNMRLSQRSFAEVRDHVLSAVRKHVAANNRPVTVAISTTGAVDRSGFVLNSGHFDGYTDISWMKVLAAEFGKDLTTVFTVNDGKASAWAEYANIARDSEVFAHFVVGTGVGGALICFGRLLYGDDETAGALGHMKVGSTDGTVCSCGRQGCVETVASGPAISRHFSELTRKHHEPSNPLSFEDVFLKAQGGMPEALRAFEVAGEWLGIAISNVINVLNPRYITIGGGVAQASGDLASDGGPYLQAAIRRARALGFDDIAEATVIRLASAGNDGGLLGAALLCAAEEDKRISP